jgi:hypothetical protein
VARLEDTLDQVRRDAGSAGSFAEFRNDVRMNPRFGAPSGDLPDPDGPIGLLHVQRHASRRALDRQGRRDHYHGLVPGHHFQITLQMENTAPHLQQQLEGDAC